MTPTAKKGKPRQTVHVFSYETIRVSLYRYHCLYIIFRPAVVPNLSKGTVCRAELRRHCLCKFQKLKLPQFPDIPPNAYTHKVLCSNASTNKTHQQPSCSFIAAISPTHDSSHDCHVDGSPLWTERAKKIHKSTSMAFSRAFWVGVPSTIWRHHDHV